MARYRWEAIVYLSGTVDSADWDEPDADEDECEEVAVDDMVEAAKHRPWWDDYELTLTELVDEEKAE